jgi:probable dihydroxyacetone kinase regulator
MANQSKNTTDQSLADSLKALVLKKPVEKITIKEITDKAGVIRPTFYNHFQDKYELLEWIVREEILSPIHPLIRNGLTNQAVLLVFMSLQREKEFYSHLSHMDGPITFEDLVVKCIKDVLMEIFSERPRSKNGKFPWMSMDMLAEYYARSMCFSVKVWIRQGMSVPAQEMADLYEYLMSHSMEQALREI